MGETITSDYLDRPLAVGDIVVYISHRRTSACLRRGVIKRFTSCFVTMTSGAKVSCDKVVKV